jgi:CHAD domain-containing protein
MIKVTALLTPQLRSLAGDLRQTIPRLSDALDTEAVHDFRVALRRLRSLLRPARSVYGRFHTDAVRAALKRVSDATGTLRDEEVLVETLTDLPLPPRAAAARDLWTQKRAARRRSLRAAFLRLVRAGEVERSLALLEALLALPVRGGRDADAARFARDVVFAAEATVHRRGEIDPLDVEAMHALRILYKRLRYAVEGFEAALSPELVAMAAVATKFQKRLGEVHDLDVARVSVERARTLDPATRTAILAAIAAARAVAVSKYVADRHRGATQHVVPAVPVAPAPVAKVAKGRAVKKPSPPAPLPRVPRGERGAVRKSRPGVRRRPPVAPLPSPLGGEGPGVRAPKKPRLAAHPSTRHTGNSPPIAVAASTRFSTSPSSLSGSHR